MTSTWLDYRQAGRRIGRSEGTIKRYRREGMQMPLRDGRRMVREDVLLAWYRDRLQAWPIHQARMRSVRLAVEGQASSTSTALPQTQHLNR